MWRFLILLSVLCCLTTPISGKAKIVNGSFAPRGRVPYIVSLQDDGEHGCGGAIYNNRTIVTAAHCIVGGSAITSARIRAGSLSTKRGGVLARISGARTHPLYNARNRHYDLGLIYLRTPLTFNDNIQPIELFDGPMRSSQNGVVSGWGTLREDGRSPTLLRILGVNVIARSLCRRSYPRLSISQYCAGFYNGGRDACDGDSGGPLEVQGQLAGIVSDGRGCARRRYPGIYASIPLLKDWIINNAR